MRYVTVLRCMVLTRFRLTPFCAVHLSPGSEPTMYVCLSLSLRTISAISSVRRKKLTISCTTGRHTSASVGERAV